VDCIFNRINSLPLGLSCIIYTVSTGIGTCLNKTVVGLGISRTLFGGLVLVMQELNFCSTLLFRQRWRMAINRSAAMTIFSVIQAGLFPIHMGRPWLVGFYHQSIWFTLNFNSPLLWDVFAISTYLSVSLVFWWTGLLPDFAMLRDERLPFNKRVYSILSFGW
jgi:molybdopterin-containing oxidoreductase family membrane subunit